MKVLVFCMLLVAGYYGTTLAIWFGHWFSHFPWSPTHEFHVGGHHALYPDSQRSVSTRFLYGTGRHDSLFALLPPLLLEALVILWLTSSWMRWTLLLEAALLAAGVSWMHAQFHTGRARFRRQEWFQRARRIHFAHHDRDANFMVADHFWDRVWGTFEA